MTREDAAAADPAQRLMDAMPMPMAELDAARLLVRANRAFLALFGTDAAAGAGRPIADIVAPCADAPPLLAWLDGLGEDTAAAIDGHILLRDGPGRPRACAMTATRMGPAEDGARHVLLRLEPDLPAHTDGQLLALVSHEMRQPLQTVRFLCDVLRQRQEDARNESLLVRLDGAAALLSEHLASLVRMHQLEAGEGQPDHSAVAVADLMHPLATEFSRHARAAGIALRYVPASLWVRSAAALLEWAVRGLLLHTLKHAGGGRILLGCRRDGAHLWIQVWGDDVQMRPAEGEAGEGSFGLAIAERLCAILGHTLHSETRPDGVAVFAIQVPLAATQGDAVAPSALALDEDTAPARGRVLVIEDDPVVRELLDLLLDGAGYEAVLASDGPAALAIVADGTRPPDIVVSDFQLPHAMNGVTAVRALRAVCGADLPAIILSGDSTTETAARIADAGCGFLGKPVNGRALIELIGASVPARPTAAAENARHAPGPAEAADDAIIVIEDEQAVAETMRDLLRAENHHVEIYPSCQAFLRAHDLGRNGIYLVDARLPGMDGLSFLRQMKAAGNPARVILMTGYGDVRMAVEAMRAGAFNFLEKPIGREELLGALGQAIAAGAEPAREMLTPEAAVRRVPGLTGRQRQVLELVLTGKASKIIAAELGLSQRTVENHRAAIMRRTGARSIPEMVRMVLAG